MINKTSSNYIENVRENVFLCERTTDWNLVSPDRMHDLEETASKIQAIAEMLKDELVQLRRFFHQRPELSWEEFETTSAIRELLIAEGLTVRPGIGKTGLVAELELMDGGKTVAIRADLDGLPMYDAKEVAYASQVAGVMHACGHDAHIAMAIGVAKVLKRLDLQLPGSIRFVFQPSEEATPSGAHKLVDAGVLDGVSAALAFHVDPEIEAGKIGLRQGVLTANCDEFRLVVLGKSGHAARPQHAVDAIFIGNRVLGALYDIIASRTQSFVPAVLSIGKVAGGTKANIIPERVEISGTIRTIDDQTRSEIFDAMRSRTRAITESTGARYELEFFEPVPSVVNDGALTNLFREVSHRFFGGDRTVEIQKVSMGGEDFAWFLSKVPGTLIRLGARKAGDKVRFLHTHDFDIDENAIPFGVSLMATTALQYLRGEC